MAIPNVTEAVKEAVGRTHAGEAVHGVFLPVYRGREAEGVRLDLRPVGPCRDLEPLSGSVINRPPGEQGVPFGTAMHCGGGLSVELLDQFILQCTLNAANLTAADHNNLACALVWLYDDSQEACANLKTGLAKANDKQVKVIKANLERMPEGCGKPPPPVEREALFGLRLARPEVELQEIVERLWVQGVEPGAVGEALDFG
jgi:hypothetical protein